MHRHGGDIYRNQNKIDYSANINFLGMPQAVRQAAKDAIDDAVHYPDPFCEALKQAIAEKEGVPAEWIFCGNGAADVIFTLMLQKSQKKHYCRFRLFMNIDRRWKVLRVRFGHICCCRNISFVYNGIF